MIGLRLRKSPTHSSLAGIVEYDPRTLRAKLKLDQAEFWGRIGLTQSAGSRYETNRRIPMSVMLLVNIVYGTRGVSIFKRLRR